MGATKTVHGSVGDTNTLGARIVAYIIDSFIAGIIFAVVGGLGVAVGEGVSGGLGALFILLGTVAAFGYKVYFEANGGQPFGKQMMGIKVIKADGSPCTWGASLIRNVLLGFEGTFIALIVILVTDKSQRVGDLAGGTVVVKA